MTRHYHSASGKYLESTPRMLFERADIDLRNSSPTSNGEVQQARACGEEVQ